MLPLPKPLLGDVSAITITSPDLELSSLYYQKLGFTELFRSDFPFPLIQMTDGSLLLMLRLDKIPYCALMYYVKSVVPVVATLEQAGIEFYQKPKQSDLVKRYLLTSPDGLNVSLVELDSSFIHPPGPNMLAMPQEDYFNPDKYVNKVCGMFGELAHPVGDLTLSILFWEKLGFIVLSKFTSPYPWAIMSDGLSVIGLHQTDKFTYPAITYFASDMKVKISKLKSEGLTDYTETGRPGSIVLTTPEKQHINLFSMGM